MCWASRLNALFIIFQGGAYRNQCKMEVFISVLLFFCSVLTNKGVFIFTPTNQNIVILIYREKLTQKYELVVCKLRYASDICTSSPVCSRDVMSVCVPRCPWCCQPSRQETRAHKPASQQPAQCLASSPIWTPPSCLPLPARWTQRMTSPSLTTGESCLIIYFRIHMQIVRDIT